MSDRLRFDRFELDVAERRLTRDGADVELSGRYLDALILLAREPGRLITKDRFLSEVWRGVPVTDEALTQCIRSLRRCLGDDAGRPRFIQTVPKHGYRFLAVPETSIPAEPPGERLSPSATEPASHAPVRTGVGLRTATAAAGGGLAGLMGGTAYGLIAASTPAEGGLGAASTVIVLMLVTAVLGALGGAAVGAGLSMARALRGPYSPWLVAGAGVGGLLIGGATELIGGDAFALLLGRRPADMTGAFEGLLLGAAVGLGALIAARAAFGSTRLAAGLGGALGGAAGLAISLSGGRLMAGSLMRLSEVFPSALRLDGLGAPFAEAAPGPLALAVITALEAALFVACVTAALTRLDRRST